MAKINPVKLKQDAEKLEIAGRPDQAVVLYRQILEENPRDWNVINKIGDIYAKMNRVKEAGEEYAKVADFYAKDGFLLKAIAIWKKINKLDASALEPYQNLAELYAKQGLLMEAKSQYQFVVDELMKRGRNREAGDILKKMADVDPADLKIRSKLADLYTRDGHSDKAVEEHVAIAEELNKKGHLAEALQVLEKGLKIAPKSQRLRMELGRVHLIQKNFEKASQYLEEAVRSTPDDPRLLNRLGEAYLGAKKVEEAEAIFKRLLLLNPADEEARIQMGRLGLIQERFDQAYEDFLPVVDRMVGRHEGDRAAALLQQIVQKNPAHIKSLRKLVEVYQAFKKEAGALATYSQLTEAYINQGRFDEAASVLELLVAREPYNQQHQTKLGFVKSRMSSARAPAAAAAAAPAGPSSDFLDEEFDLGQPEPEAPAPVAGPPRAHAAPSGASRSRPAIETSGPLSEDDREFVDEHLAEGRVFRKYGLVDKAADQFHAVVARFPDNLEARQELREIYKEKGDIPKAVEQCLAVAEILRLRGDLSGAEVQEEAARLLLPEAVEPPAPAPRAGNEPSRGARRPPAPEEEEISLEGEEVTLEQSEVNLGAGSLGSFSLEEADEEEGTGFEGQFGQHFLDEEDVVMDEEPPFVQSGPAAAAQEQDAGPLGLILEDNPLESALEESPFAGSLLEPAPLEALALDVVAPEATGHDLPAALRRVLAEVDDYVALGFVEDAKEALREIAAKHKGHPALQAKMSELGIEMEGPPARPTSAAQGEVDVELSFGEPEIFPPPVRPAMQTAAPDIEIELEAAPAVSERQPPAVHEEPLPLEIDEEAPPLAIEMEAPPLEVGVSPFDRAPKTLDVEIEAPEPGEEGLRLEEVPLTLASDEPMDEGLEIALSTDDAEADALFASDLEEQAEPVAVALPADLGSADSLFEGEAGFLDPDPEAEAVDLASELGDLFGAQTAVEEAPLPASGTELGELGLADIFKEFKKGVDKQLSQEDYDTRYNLGIAYKEMGLLDEAIAEFQLAAKDPNRLLECSSMLGICFMDKGMPKLAIKWFERGLKSEGRTEEEYLGLRYDLASAHEAAGDSDTALSIYTELYGQDANFRDVATKVKERRGARTSG